MSFWFPFEPDQAAKTLKSKTRHPHIPCDLYFGSLESPFGIGRPEVLGLLRYEFQDPEPPDFRGGQKSPELVDVQSVLNIRTLMFFFN